MQQKGKYFKCALHLEKLADGDSKILAERDKDIYIFFYCCTCFFDYAGQTFHMSISNSAVLEYQGCRDF